MKNLIAISGKIGSGKDLTGKILQVLANNPRSFDGMLVVTEQDVDYKIWDVPKYQIKKFADKLKDMVCLLLNCTREQLENREFKDKELREEWWYYKFYQQINDSPMQPYLVPYISNEGKKDLNSFEHPIIKLTPRKLLQLLGTECGRNIIHPNVWVNALFADYISKREKFTSDKQFANNDDYPNWIITDCRFPNELEAVKSRDGITIRINRACEDCGVMYNNPKAFNGHDKYCRNVTNIKHESETALDNAEFDYVIDNNGTIKDLIEELKKLNIF